MEKERKTQLMIRWSIVTAGLIAVFWTIWYLMAGQVPVVTSIKITDEWTLQLPFGISRWWDILIGPIWSILSISILTNKKIKKDEDSVHELQCSLVLGLIFLLALGVVFVPVFGIVFGLVYLFYFLKLDLSEKIWSAISWLLAEDVRY